jgi:hypothetical protein
MSKQSNLENNPDNCSAIAAQYFQDIFKLSHHDHILKLMIPFITSKYGDKSF